MMTVLLILLFVAFISGAPLFTIMAGAGAVAAVIVLIPRDPGPVQQQPPPTIVP